VSERLALQGSPLAPRSAVVTVGTFDGVHRGHQALLNQLIAVAHQQQKQHVVVTFNPHPLHVIRAADPPALLTPTAEKIELLRAHGIEQVAVVPFSRELAEYTPDRFVREILIEHFGLAHLVIGYDHGFGKGRSGDVSALSQIGRELHFELTVVPHTDLGDRPIKSSRIRAALNEGNVIEAAHALGRPYALDGEVVRGDARGRELGFPTANLEVIGEHKLVPAEGIYAVRVDRLDAIDRQRYDGVLHLGERPTFEGATRTIEVFLLGFDGNLYGERLRVHFCERIRGIDRFDGVDALIAAIRADIEAAQRVLTPASEGQGKG
jgi:riboflavin kinase / FMN adenylyltransferase